MRLDHTLVAGVLAASGVDASPVHTNGVQEHAATENKIRAVSGHLVPKHAALNPEPNQEAGPKAATTVIIRGTETNNKK